MNQLDETTVALAQAIKAELAGNNLPPPFAKLYSQHTRLRAGRLGLTGWRTEEASERLDDAVRLIEVGFIEREIGSEDWQVSLRRAAELLEWLSHPQLNLQQPRVPLLAAAAYQLAGYPARATGLLNRDIEPEISEFTFLRSLLRADFPTLLEQLSVYWAQRMTPPVQRPENEDSFHEALERSVLDAITSSLGLLCAEMRWEDTDSRLDKALEKLRGVAKVNLHSDDQYSWLLAKLCAEVASHYTVSSMRKHLAEFADALNSEGQLALTRYLRQAYQNRRSLAWPSQVRGIEKLTEGQSFALCTPTGSGKTTVAELAILQSLFGESQQATSTRKIALYLVPSRALATELEAKLSGSMGSRGPQSVVVTGLYGGADWGPTDAWITENENTVLICTYEKAEALVRFVGTSFLNEVALVIIDEAHSVQFTGDTVQLCRAESRALRLEALCARLFAYLDQNQMRVIALSAVASGAEKALASWVARDLNAGPVKSAYRSTRQLIGRLECLPNRGFEIRYDLLDRADLQFEQERDEGRPYIPNPFPPYPPASKLESGGPEKRLRPYLFWASMHLAAPDDSGLQHSVLISIAQGIGGYAEDLLTLLDATWADEAIPEFFRVPTDTEKLDLWQTCLRICEDYFGNKSREYQLLQKGIVVHHGKMPGLLARLLVEVIQDRIVNLVLATSTLSEGVNLPFETVLVPSLRRGSGEIDVREFTNVAGRAGRPGFGTEGRTLVVLNASPGRQRLDWSTTEARNRYFSLIRSLEEHGPLNLGDAGPSSPLAELITCLFQQWLAITEQSSDNPEQFLRWLEQVAPIDIGRGISREDESKLIDAVDTLDSLLLSAIVEIEQMDQHELTPDELGGELKRVWQHSYAHYAIEEEELFEQIFVHRGKALMQQVYPSSSRRRQLYRTGLPPRSADELLALYPQVKEYLETGQNYALWRRDRRFEYIQGLVDLLVGLPAFNIDQGVGRGRSQVGWPEVLRWWLDPKNAASTPTRKQITNWHNYVSKTFGYQFNWWLGSIISLVVEDIRTDDLFVPTLDSWPETGLPWVVCWLKELIAWGTLEPVAAYALARGMRATRADAEAFSQRYYDTYSSALEPDELLDAVRIKDWIQLNLPSSQTKLGWRPPTKIGVQLLRDFSKAAVSKWRVIPTEGDAKTKITWFDVAGFPLASCGKPKGWRASAVNTHDFILDSLEGVVESTPYI